MSDEYLQGEPELAIKSSILDSMRQLGFPAEFRISMPEDRWDAFEMVDTVEEQRPVVQPAEPPRPSAPDDRQALQPLVTELVTCLWYLKTQYLKRGWDDHEIGDDDPRVRRALGRVRKAIDTLTAHGIEVYDPTHSRYPSGGEGLMRPIEFRPTAGVAFEIVTETVVPIIYRDEQLIQRGEVFVAVPQGETRPASGPPGQPPAPRTLE